jgi:type III pantothenate kinase
MNLLIDSGNSFIKWALANDDSFIMESSCPSKETLSLHDSWKSYDAPARVIVSNVAEESIASEIRKVVTSLWQLDVEFIVSSKNCCGLVNSYHRPSQLGVDRWLAMVAAYQMTLSTVIVIDCGTAVTIDLVNEKGHFLGGVIMPGLSSALKSLGADTDAVGVIGDTGAITRTTAQSTEEAVQAGVLYGLAGGIERVVREHALSVDKVASIFITGGDAEKLTPYMRISTILQTDLVLQGLRLFAEKDVLHDK